MRSLRVARVKKTRVRAVMTQEVAIELVIETPKK
jgi:hypothetical protein